MGHLSNRNIIIGVSGGIAAYKSAELVRLLKKAGAAVRVILTRGAQEFITPLTLQALSGEPVHTELLDEQAEAGMGHIELARWADLVIIAPATADVLARLAQGRADDLLTTVVLATPAPVWIAPAMNQQMWSARATQSNVAILDERGFFLLGPDSGQQACGDVGEGRLLEPAAIFEQLAGSFDTGQLTGRRIVITAGPTREAIDPVRYISNHSSGKMGFALARAAAAAGAETILIAGPVHLDTPDRVRRVDVITADDMMKSAVELAAGADVFIGAAAVADYRAASIAGQKIKKSQDTMTLSLTKNPDIIASIAQAQGRPRLVVGFAAETEHLIEHARGKLSKKAIDLIVANNVADTTIGFNSDQNAVTVISPETTLTLPEASKQIIAERLISIIAEHLQTTSTSDPRREDHEAKSVTEGIRS